MKRHSEEGLAADDCRCCRSAGLLIAIAGATHASGGRYHGKTANGCGEASGQYHYCATSLFNGKQACKADWGFGYNVDLCGADGVTEGLYTTYTKWNGSSWANDGNFHHIALVDHATNVADAKLFIRHVGDGNSCKSVLFN